MSKLSIVGICLTGSIAIVQLIYWFPLLPDPMPVHFDGAGNPDRTGSRAGFLALNIGLHLMFLVGFPLLGVSLAGIPNQFINVPRRDYWLTETRRESTLSFFRQYLAWTGIATSWLIIALVHLNGMVAIGARQSLTPEFWIALTAYLVLILGSCVYILIRFSRVPKESPGSTQPVDQRYE